MRDLGSTLKFCHFERVLVLPETLGSLCTPALSVIYTPFTS